jgi:hypothetical protein
MVNKVNAGELMPIYQAMACAVVSVVADIQSMNTEHPP